MQQIVYYPCLVRETYWVVGYERFGGSGPVRRSVTQIAACTTDDGKALAAWRKLADEGHAPGLRRYDEVFFPRCGVCGERPYGASATRPELSWDAVLQVIYFEPAWLATSEQLVFCPYHRPEDAEE
ncbi:hypothetical protein ATK30_8690 [Amycolatopsis echigonensis]|uniref:Uncharacterized protein n=1 Tax=Amycolatopsis echigonensis TaxID=2576905 RepID=A0A2N3WV12_9PSEU|nr:hypothetical protein [Amycolatopsis niigatensis]PKV97695.1 hypothetical protein ATK30_8690 [Amycolatopsis niigatensis]